MAPIEPMTLQNMRENGVRSLWVQCLPHRQPGRLSDWGKARAPTLQGPTSGRLNGGRSIARLISECAGPSFQSPKRVSLA
jgi:hypothetical protein